jgi:hypothetical protein
VAWVFDFLGAWDLSKVAFMCITVVCFSCGLTQHLHYGVSRAEEQFNDDYELRYFSWLDVGWITSVWISLK